MIFYKFTFLILHNSINWDRRDLYRFQLDKLKIVSLIISLKESGSWLEEVQSRY